ncbi:MAG: UDP-N-acetylmuramate dehydrogenase [Patescibacteria group bacterium]|jgi:UDP-N-acetylmuramate dehydrogenase
MSDTSAIEKLPGIKKHELMSRHTTFKIGGPADYYFVARSKPDIVQAISSARSSQLPYLVIGHGSNLLVSDAGIRGLVIRIENDGISRAGSRVTADAGVSLGRLALWTVEQGLTGAEFISGIPGSIGGSIRGNAGAMGGELKDIVVCVEALDEAGQFRILANSECQFAYRDSRFKHNSEIIISAVFQLAAGQPAVGLARLKEYALKRSATQDYSIPSAGCMFKNPAGQSAGKLIDDLGFKGRRVGDAMVSPTHANFITNVGHATAAQVVELVALIKQSVLEKHGIELGTEVQFIGF